MKTDNELIAEFMGYVYYPYKAEEKGYLHGWTKPDMNRKFGAVLYKQDRFNKYLARTTSDLKYHTSWDWLMPVVEKIESLRIVDLIIKKESVTFIWIDNPDKWIRRQIIIDNDTRLSILYKAVVEFIKWCNASKS